MSDTKTSIEPIAMSIYTKILMVLVITLCSPSFAMETGLEQYGSENAGVIHVNATEAAEILSKYPLVKVLDVRTGPEYYYGHLSNSININYYSFSFKKQLDQLDKRVTWLIHCRTGVRSGKSLEIMKSLGFESIIHLDGGIVAWTDDGHPVHK